MAIENKLTPKEEEIAEFLQSRGYEGPVPLYTALLIESLFEEQTKEKES